MSTTVGLYGASGTSYVLQQAVNTLTDEQTDLAAQTSTGVKSQSYAGLGDDRAQALSLQPQITAVSTWQTTVSSAQTNLSVTQTALTQISSIASSLQTSVLSLSGNLGQQELQTIAATAKSDLAQLGTLLNTTSGTGYVFAGTDSTNPPVTDASDLATSTLATETASAVSSLSTDGAAAVFQQATVYASDNSSSTSVFSSALSVSADSVSTSSLESKAVVGPDGATSTTGMVATEGTEASSDTTTGSPIRDLMRNLMIVASLGSADTSSSQFSDLVSTLQSATTSNSSALTAKQGSLGITQNTLTSQASLLTSMSTMLSSQLDDTKSVDYATLSTQTTQIQDQLQASYTLISDMKSMTLASYI
ncbi:flagellin [Acetobacter fallax]|uniref:Flagellar biosynthesis protein FlgL n=1 Tax=Acetobacter fallax TaxID=1737473 RepID=A0ABX0KBN4_9PROT|nr:flagellin [Acetobacter fallax]NHO33829.1 flagellar biosynthesis protein FlgL [Acetobacter fallax]NHO37392.1 flagellar biosynthesis protein FlgL [Acetobacter fallax]